MLGLFLGAVVNHWLFSFGGVGLMILAIIEKVRKKDTEAWIFWGGALACLFIACYGAWVDEHNNTTAVISEKADVWSKYNGCSADVREKGQEIIGWSARFGDQMGFITGLQGRLNSQQGTVDSLQSTLAKQQAAVTTCVGDLAKAVIPEPQHTGMFFLTVPAQAPANRFARHFLLTTNKNVSPVRLIFQCSSAKVDALQPVILPAGPMIGGAAPVGDGHSFRINITTPVWAEEAPLVLEAVIDKEDAALADCKVWPF